MMILRIWGGVIDHFPVRRSEWINSFVMIGWGTINVIDGQPFTGAWEPLTRVAQDYVWATALISLGFLRLLVLLINGTFPASWYGGFAPHARIAVSFFSSIVWLQLFMATIYAPTLTTGIAAYLGFLVSDVLNTLSSAAEARELDKGRKDVAARTVDPREFGFDELPRDRVSDRSSLRLRQEKPDDSDASEVDRRDLVGRQLDRHD